VKSGAPTHRLSSGDQNLVVVRARMFALTIPEAQKRSMRDLKLESFAQKRREAVDPCAPGRS
jgi:hypothetical protein